MSNLIHQMAPDGTMVVCVSDTKGPHIPPRLEGESDAEHFGRLFASASTIRVSARMDKPGKVATLVLP